MRQGLQRPTTLVTYPGLRLGNYLYFALHAHLQQAGGRRYRVLDTGLGDGWRELFPALGPLFTDGLRPWAGRENIPPLFWQEYGADFSASQLRDFIRARLLTGTLDRARRHPGITDGSALTVNVRRGDFYEDEHRRKYAFDIRGYLREVLGEVLNHADVTTVYVVSDDPRWATAAMMPLVGNRKMVTVSDGDPVSDFVHLAFSRRLVITNSTFSYWGAYVAGEQLGSDHLGVWAPDFGQRDVRDGRPWQHDPSWHVRPVRSESEGADR